MTGLIIYLKEISFFRSRKGVGVERRSGFSSSSPLKREALEELTPEVRLFLITIESLPTFDTPLFILKFANPRFRLLAEEKIPATRNVGVRGMPTAGL
ncbi:hypothetical protein CDAR_387441 [Caerostris darwini]|uniref:Uncharacterized protein n=1 Tax=Caerostris darwini TaxID=1538125 RepID=A0AAV4N0X6_9ARAC|nr:hypothetical protein CDAR_387441 [Caerostris darwini]